MKLNIVRFILLVSLSITLVSSQTCSDNCADCGGDASVCYACQPGFQLSVLSKCLPQTTIDRCILYGPANRCFVCQPTYQLQNNKCVKEYAGCLNLIDGKCLQCGFGTLLDQDKCRGTINCQNSQSTCSKCIQGYTLKNSKCYPNQGCKNFDQSVGVCKQCESGYGLIGYQCIQSSKKVYDCYVYNNNSQCLNCKYGFIPYQNQCLLPDGIQDIQSGVKKITDVLLVKKQKYDAKYPPQIINSNTVPDNKSTNNNQNSNVAKVDPPAPIFKIDNCKVTDILNKICALCEDRFYRSGSQCLLVKDVCKQYDMTNGKCTTCIDGYDFKDGDCTKKVVIIPSPPNNDNQPQSNTQGGAIIINPTSNGGSSVPGAATSNSKDSNCLNFQSNKCTKCSNRYYLSLDGICVPVNPLCENYNQKGACTSCYKGYKILGEVCIAAQQKDPYCKQSDANNVCKFCFDGYFVNSNKTCQPLNPLCKSSDLTNGKCTGCYMGYTLAEGSCKIFVKDPNCQQYDSNSNCIKCPSRFYVTNGSCRQVNPLCKDYDKVTGLCTQCYPGYVNDKGSCNIANSRTDDLSCKQKKNGTCVSCYNGYYLNTKTMRCQLQNLICKSINPQNGNCTTCYDGYSLQSGNCSLASSQTADLYCKTFDSMKKCTECYLGYFIDTNGLCEAFDPTCKQSDKKTGACKSCYSGFNLIGAKCVSDTPALGLNADPYCIKIQGTKCLQCNKGYFVATNNVCTQADILCKTYSLQNGFCTSCYTGYVLSNSKCILGQNLYIPFCIKANSQGKCIECNDRYYLSNDVCTPVNLLCDAYNKTTGKCITCTPGYFFQNEQCIYPALGVDPGCEFYTNSYCTRCKKGFYLQNFFCQAIDSKCIQFDYTKNICVRCFNSTPQGVYCS